MIVGRLRCMRLVLLSTTVGVHRSCLPVCRGRSAQALVLRAPQLQARSIHPASGARDIRSDAMAASTEAPMEDLGALEEQLAALQVP